MIERVVTGQPMMQDGWLSFCGAVAGVLQSLGRPYDTVDVGGYSGYAFLLNVTEGWTDPGSPTLHSGNMEVTPQEVQQLWAELHHGVESLGVALDVFWDPRQFRSWVTPLAVEDRQRARQLFERVRAEIDQGRPAVVWGLVVPEYGIVKGYAGDHYLVSTFRSTIGQPEDPVRYDELQAKGGLEAIFFREGTVAPAPEVDRQALRRAITIGEGTPWRFEFATPQHPIRETQRYVTGPAAYDEWARVLGQAVPDTIFYEYNSYIAACAHEARGMAARFLERLADKYAAQPQGAPLRRAAGAYAQAEAGLRRLVELFPYADSGDLSQERCAEGAGVLRDVKPYELEALEQLRAAEEAWV